MDERLRDRVTNGIGPIARRESAGIEKHRHCCATLLATCGATAMSCLPPGAMYTERSIRYCNIQPF
jgi:hypothetical protein